jgi:RimJ/RimL family protein N-acetyltransferase
VLLGDLRQEVRRVFIGRRALCHYGFRFRNLHRIELETLATNAAMRKLAESCGFVLEGIQREQA